jgi:anti-sigma B factor antagonist
MIFAITEHKHYKHCDYVKVKGSIDEYTAQELKTKFDEILEVGTFRIIFDMSDVERIYKLGIFVLMQTNSACKSRSGKLVLFNIPEKFNHFFDDIGLYLFIEDYDDINEAVDSF